MFKKFLILFFSIALFSCARTFRYINPAIYNFENRKEVNPDLTVSYFYNIQTLVKNKPYSRKERKKGLKLIAVKIENHSEDPIKITAKNFKIQTLSGRKVTILRPEYYAREIRQSSELFTIFYGIAGIGAIEQSSPNGGSEVLLTYNPIPLLIGIGNTIYAGVSNSNQKKNLAEFRIFDKTISPNSFIYGLIPIEEISFPELQFVYDTTLGNDLYYE